MKQARFTKHAKSELLGQTAYYEAIERGLGTRFRSEVEAAAQRAAAFPLHGKPSAGGTRRRLVTDFPFSVVYIFIAAPVDEVVPELYKVAGGGGKLIL